jgi:putative membrane protein
MSELDKGSDKQAAEPMAVAARPAFGAALRSAFSNWWGKAPPVGPKESSDELAEDRTGMATVRTLLAADRTLMAWIRTSLSLSSFGFTIYKVLEAVVESGVKLRHDNTPTSVGLFLTGLGTFAMVMGVVEYAQTVRDLRAFKNVGLWRPSFIMAALMAIMSLFLFFSIFAKVA